MAQLSRPYQLALAAVALLGLVWAVALRGHAPGHGGSTGSVPSTPAPAASAKAEERAAAAPTPIYHGAAPGVEGLTRAIAKAHGAVATSQRNAQQLQQDSRAASQEAQSRSASSAAGSRHSTAAPAHARKAAAPARHRAAQTHKSSGRRSGARRAGGANGSTAGRPTAQVAVEHEVAAGKTVLLLFWTSQSSVDREVRAQTAAMVAGSHGRLALHVAAPGQVGEFGPVTEVAHVFQTPTVLIVNRRGVVSTLTGLTDSFALRQLVHEAERANG